MREVWICLGLILIPIFIYIIFRAAGLGWYTSMIEVIKLKWEGKNEVGNKKHTKGKSTRQSTQDGG